MMTTTTIPQEATRPAPVATESTTSQTGRVPPPHPARGPGRRLALGRHRPEAGARPLRQPGGGPAHLPLAKSTKARAGRHPPPAARLEALPPPAHGHRDAILPNGLPVLHHDAAGQRPAEEEEEPEADHAVALGAGNPPGPLSGGRILSPLTTTISCPVPPAQSWRKTSNCVRRLMT